MCGIAGIVAKDGRAPEPGVLDAFARALAHRGPDGTGRWTNGATGLVHTRLSIIDVEGGDQPLFGDDGSVLVGNGEIYNFVELRAEQERAGTAFRTRADFEPAQNLLASGADAVAGWRGMYAAAVAWPQDGRLLLARDPFGIKPLYLMDTPDFLAFASEPRAFFAAGLATPALDETRVTELLQRQYTVGTATVFDGILRLGPGRARLYQAGAPAGETHVPWLPPAPAAPPADLDAAVAAFDRTFENSVAVHQRSDVPYGMFLSGGLDSTALLTMMARLNDRPVRTFTCAFPDTKVHDERAAARKVAEAFGAEHTEIAFTEEDFWTLLPRIVDAFDEPTADYAILPTWKLGQAAKDGVKVVLSGEGGDEILGGYGRYRKLMRPWWLGGKAPRVKGTLDGLGLLRDDGRDWATAAETLAAGHRGGALGRLQAAQATDIDGWLPADLLLKLDRALMAHGIEGRTPFLDPAVAAMGFRLPDDMKVRDNLGKWVLRAWLAKHCSATDAFARKKGFTVPVGDWIARRGVEIGDAVAATSAIAERCHTEAVRDLFHRGAEAHPRAAWSLLFFAVWHRRHVEGARLTEDTLSFLAG